MHSSGGKRWFKYDTKCRNGNWKTLTKVSTFQLKTGFPWERKKTTTRTKRIHPFCVDQFNAWAVVKNMQFKRNIWCFRCLLNSSNWMEWIVGSCTEQPENCGTRQNRSPFCLWTKGFFGRLFSMIFFYSTSYTDISCLYAMKSSYMKNVMAFHVHATDIALGLVQWMLNMLIIMKMWIHLQCGSW